jgi:hypothetical protein
MEFPMQTATDRKLPAAVSVDNFDIQELAGREMASTFNGAIPEKLMSVLAVRLHIKETEGE